MGVFGIVALGLLSGVLVGVVQDRVGGGPAIAVFVVSFAVALLALKLLVLAAQRRRADDDPVSRRS